MQEKKSVSGGLVLALLAVAVLVTAAVIWGGGVFGASGAPTTIAADVNVDENSNGKTMTVAPNTVVHLVLHSTYWNVQSVSDARVLQQVNAPVVTPDLKGGLPGSGAGTVAVDYKAVGNGSVHVQASRQTCGEALRCTGDQGSFSVTLVVKG